MVFILFFILSLLVREAVGLTTFFLGVYILFVMKEKKHGIMTSGISLFYFLLVKEEDGIFLFKKGMGLVLRNYENYRNYSYL